MKRINYKKYECLNCGNKIAIAGNVEFVSCRCGFMMPEIKRGKSNAKD